MLASTSEVYGDPQVHPQTEDYWGHVNPIGPRGVYDEAKRFAEAMTMAYHRYHGVDTRIVRIFNTYGPRCGPTTAAWCPTSSSRRCWASPHHLRRRPARPAASATSTTRCGGSSPCSTPTSTGPSTSATPASSPCVELAELVLERHRLEPPRSSTSRCPSTTPSSGDPTSPWPASCSAGSPRCPCARAWYRTDGLLPPRPRPGVTIAHQAGPCLRLDRAGLDGAGLGLVAVGEVPLDACGAGRPRSGPSASKPNYFLARLASTRRRGWPSGLRGVPTDLARRTRPGRAMISTRSRMGISSSVPRLTGSPSS